MIKSSQHSISIMIYENGLPPQNTSNATTAITDVVHYPRYYGTATLVSDNEMRIELRGHLDKNGINTESVPESLKNLTATIGTVGTPIKPESKFFVPTWTLTIPKTEVWDEIRVTQVPQVEEAASASPHDQQEIAQLKQQLLEKEYSIAQLQVELSKSDRAPIPRVPTIYESTGTATVIMSNDPPTLAVPQSADPEPKVAISYELPPSADPNKFLEMVKTLLQVEHDASAVLSADRTSLRFEGSLSDHEKVEILLDMFNATSQRKPNVVIGFGINFNYILAEDAQKVLKIYYPDLESHVSSDMNALHFAVKRDEGHKIIAFLKALDKASEGNAIPPTVNPGTTSTLPWYGPTPPDPVAGKYLATDEDGRQIGFELTRQEAAPALQGWPVPNTTMPSPTTYRIVMYEGGLPDDGFKEDRGRMIGTATFNGHKLDVEWELSHDGKRYNVLTSERQSGRILRDGETMLLLLSSGENDTEGMVAAKVKEEKPEPAQPPHVR